MIHALELLLLLLVRLLLSLLFYPRGHVHLVILRLTLCEHELKLPCDVRIIGTMGRLVRLECLDHGIAGHRLLERWCVG